jgi:hypothetical protein
VFEHGGVTGSKLKVVGEPVDVEFFDPKHFFDDNDDDDDDDDSSKKIIADSRSSNDGLEEKEEKEEEEEEEETPKVHKRVTREVFEIPGKRSSSTTVFLSVFKWEVSNGGIFYSLC